MSISSILSMLLHPRRLSVAKPPVKTAEGAPATIAPPLDDSTHLITDDQKPVKVAPPLPPRTTAASMPMTPLLPPPLVTVTPPHGASTHLHAPAVTLDLREAPQARMPEHTIDTRTGFSLTFFYRHLWASFCLAVREDDLKVTANGRPKGAMTEGYTLGKRVALASILSSATSLSEPRLMELAKATNKAAREVVG